MIHCFMDFFILSLKNNVNFTPFLNLCADFYTSFYLNFKVIDLPLHHETP